MGIKRRDRQGFGVTALAALAAGLGCSSSSTFSPTPAPVTPAPAVSVTVAGAPQTRLDQTTQFAAAAANTSNTAVTWQVNGVTEGSAAIGTISPSGLYTAPAAIPSGGAVTVGAISQAASSASGTLAEAIWNPVPVLTSAAATHE